MEAAYSKLSGWWVASSHDQEESNINRKVVKKVIYQHLVWQLTFHAVLCRLTKLVDRSAFCILQPCHHKKTQIAHKNHTSLICVKHFYEEALSPKLPPRTCLLVECSEKLTSKTSGETIKIESILSRKLCITWTMCGDTTATIEQQHMEAIYLHNVRDVALKGRQACLDTEIPRTLLSRLQHDLLWRGRYLNTRASTFPIARGASRRNCHSEVGGASQVAASPRPRADRKCVYIDI